MSEPIHSTDERHGARQKERFNPARAAVLDDPARFDYLPIAEVASLLELPHAGTVVDYGAGTGTYAIELARTRPDAQVIALDELPEMLAYLCAKPISKTLANLKPMSSDEIRDYEARSDRVLALNVLHELGDAALESLMRLLKPDGVAVFIDWNAAVERPAGPPADHVYSPAEARTRLESRGFEILCERKFPYHYAFRARRRL